MNQCVPSWDLDENSGMPGNDLRANSNSNSLLPDVPNLDYEVAELTWKNGQLAMHGLGPPRMGNKPIFTSAPTAKYSTWEKPRAGGTLESIVNQATRLPDPKSALYGGGDELVPWFDNHRAMVHHPAASASVAMTMDALVPCNNNNIIINRNENQVPSARAMESVPQSGTCVVGSSTRVGSCSGVAAATLDGGIRGARIARVEINSCDTNGSSASESATCGRDSRQLTLDTCDKKLGTTGFTSPSTESPENTSSAKEYTKSTGDDHDSVCHSRPQREKCEEEGKKRGTGKFSLSTKRSRAAAIHNQSERKRRDRINQRMKTLQKLVPNSSKTDKASMLDEVIEYLKQLQAQVQIMRMNMSPMMLPLAMQQQLQMSMMHQASPMGMGMGMGMAGMGMPGIGMPGIGMPGIGIMDINNAMGRPSGMAPPPATAFMPMAAAAASWDNPGDHRLSAPAASVMTDPLSAFLACQSQLMTFDAYSRLAAMYQQFQHPPGSNSKN